MASTMEERGKKGYTKQLRVALAMRGGVSLAVWIGGALAEMDLARRALKKDTSLDAQSPEGKRAAAYKDALEKCGFDSIEFDVLAGASAGGLNAVVYGFAQACGIDLEWLLKVWEDKGDIWRLFHPQWSLIEPFRTEAVLDGDGRFFEPLLEALQSEGGDPREDLKSTHVTIDLSATIQSGPALPDIRTGEDLRPRRAHFRFLHMKGGLDEHTKSIPTTRSPEDPESVEKLRRLAYAARATSSFPGAFEPAAIFSWRPGSEVSGDGESVEPLHPNMAQVFSEVVESRERHFDVMDGGVFDNIPISRAVHAIQDAPANVPTRRILIYLDPSPPIPVQPEPDTKVWDGQRRVLRARFLRSVAKALVYKQTTESSAEDLVELEELRIQGDERARRRELLYSGGMEQLFVAGTTQEGDPPVGQNPDIVERYKEFRISSDAERLAKLLVAPGWEFLHTLVPPPAVTKAVSPKDISDVRQQLEVGLRARLKGRVPVSDPTALLEAADFFISWIRRAQDQLLTGVLDSQTGAASEALGEAKGGLYGVRSFARHEQGTRDARAVLSVLGGESVVSGDSGPQALVAEGGWASLAVVVAEVLYPGQDVDSEPGEESPLEAAWTTLCQHVNNVWGHLLQGGPTPPILTPDAVRGLVVNANIAVGRLGTPAVPDFYEISGDESVPQQSGLDAEDPLGMVRRRSEALRLDRQVKDPEMRTPWPSGSVQARGKLAGTGVANFAGFLATDARTHDWMWGRADAGAGLVRVLEEMSSQPTSNASTRGLVAVESEEEKQLKKQRAAAFEAARKQVKALREGNGSTLATVSNMSPTRRYAIAARLGLGLQRALWPLDPSDSAPSNEWLGKTARLMTAFVLGLLRPLFVFLPLVIRRSALFGVLGSAVVAAHLLGAGSDHAVGEGWLLFGVVLATVVTLVGFVIRIKRFRAWKKLGAEWGSGGRRPGDRGTPGRSEAAYLLGHCLGGGAPGTFPVCAGQHPGGGSR